MLVRVDDLTIDPEIQLEARGLKQDTVQAYVEAIASGAEFPPVVAFDDGATKWLADGFHRVHASKFSGLMDIEADLKPGTREDAMVYAALANVTHGKPMSQAEKREAGERLIRLTSWGDREIGRRLAVEAMTVGRWRSEASITNVTDEPRQISVTRGGSTYTMDVRNIGRREEPSTILWEDVRERLLEDPEVKAAYDDLTQPEQLQPAPQNVHFMSESDEWYTPEGIIRCVLDAFGEIDLDPCSNSQDCPNVPAKRHFTVLDNGLSQPWFGRIYMNPPYGREIVEWVSYLCNQKAIGNVTEAIALVPSRTDTQWFRSLKKFPRCFIWGRLMFSGQENSAPFPSMAVYLGDNVERFAQAFGNIGDVYQLYEA